VFPSPNPSQFLFYGFLDGEQTERLLRELWRLEMERQYNGDDEPSVESNDLKSAPRYHSMTSLHTMPVMSPPPRRHSFHGVPTLAPPIITEEILAAKMTNERYHKLFRLPSEEGLTAGTYLFPPNLQNLVFQ